jgi:hypothetical protein
MEVYLAMRTTEDGDEVLAVAETEEEARRVFAGWDEHPRTLQLYVDVWDTATHRYLR